MPIFNDDTISAFPEYNFAVIEERANAFQRQERFSQSREAARLKPVIRGLLVASPDAPAAQIADTLVAARKSGGDALGRTFRREVGTVVSAVKKEIRTHTSGHIPSCKETKPIRRPMTPRNGARSNHVTSPVPIDGTSTQQGTAASPTEVALADVVNVQLLGGTGVAVQPAPASSPKPALAPESDELRPYRFTGRFAGRTFVHGRELQKFYTAVQDERPMQEIAALVAPVLASSTARAKLAELAPADREIFESMASWAKARGI